MRRRRNVFASDDEEGDAKSPVDTDAEESSDATAPEDDSSSDEDADAESDIEIISNRVRAMRITPEKGTRTTPENGTGTAPEKDIDTAPKKRTRTAPEKDIRTAPKNRTRTAPENRTRFFDYSDSDEDDGVGHVNMMPDRKRKDNKTKARSDDEDGFDGGDDDVGIFENVVATSGRSIGYV